MATYSGKKNNLKKLGTPVKKFHNCKTEKKPTYLVRSQ